MKPSQVRQATENLLAPAQPHPEETAALEERRWSSPRSHVHRILRSVTAAAHHALDLHPLMKRLVGDELTPELYAESLAATYRGHAGLERQVHDSHHHFESGLKLSTRLGLLEADLRELGWSVPQVPRSPVDPSEGRAAWLGRAYVLEGSRQGAAVIARCLQSSLGGAVPSRFFGQALVPDAFNAFLGMLDRELQEQSDLEQAGISAQAAFASYQAALDAPATGAATTGRDRRLPI